MWGTSTHLDIAAKCVRDEIEAPTSINTSWGLLLSGSVGLSSSANRLQAMPS